MADRITAAAPPSAASTSLSEVARYLHEGKEIRDHSGAALSPEMEFFAEPPPEIGNVLSCHTTLERGKQPNNTEVRVALAVSIALGLGLVIGLMAHGTRDGKRFAFGLAGGALGGLVAWCATSFRHSCSYVGEMGVAVFQCAGSRNNTSLNMFLFESAAELRTSETRQYTNSAYMGTRYSFIWTNRRRHKAHAFSGTYNSAEGRPVSSDQYWLAVAAELAWSNYLLERMCAQLNQTGFVEFALSGSDSVRIGQGWLELRLNGAVERLNSNIGSLSIGRGVFTVRRNDSSNGFLGIGAKGVWSFQYSSMANARLFLLAIDKLLGLRF